MILARTSKRTLAAVAAAAWISAPSISRALDSNQLACLTASLSAGSEYLTAVFEARQDCLASVAGLAPEQVGVDCLASLDQGTGDDEIDSRLRLARQTLAKKLARNCLGVVMEDLGFPAFCPDLDGPPYTVFDHELCLADIADEVVTNLLDIERPLPPGQPDASALACGELVARSASRMFTSELDARATCLRKQAKGRLSAAVDCRAEADPLAPGTGDNRTDGNVVAAHDKVLQRIANHCTAVDLAELGFPHRCTNVVAGTVYPLAALVECMFDTHHGDLMRVLDRLDPAGSKCGNGGIDFTEQCDDGDIAFHTGDLCLADCRVNGNCGDPDGSGLPTINDVLYVLRVSVGLASCALEVCDVNSDGHITATDALTLLRFVVGIAVDLVCPAPLSLTCGNGIIEPHEQCDDGEAAWKFGEVCNASCRRLACGDANDSGSLTASDAQFILRAAVGLDTCDLAVCDVNGDGIIATADVLLVLQAATGQPIELNCPF